jgi:hypothetical protein
MKQFDTKHLYIAKARYPKQMCRAYAMLRDSYNMCQHVTIMKLFLQIHPTWENEAI